MAARPTNPMVVNYDRIPEQGLTLDEAISPALLKDAMAGTDFVPSSELRLPAQLQKVSGGVLLRGNFALDVTGPCKRCVVDVKLSLPVSFPLNLIPKSLVKGDDYVDEAGEDDQKA